MELTIREAVRAARANLLLIARTIDSTESATNTEHDLIEMMNVTRMVCESRFAFLGVTHEDAVLVPPGVVAERKGDDKNDFALLYDSARLDCIDAIRTTFANELNRSGPIAQRFNTVGLDSIFAALRTVHPERVPTLIRALEKAFLRDLRSLGEADEIDALVAVKTVSSLIKARTKRNTKPLTYAERMAAIDAAVLKLTELAA